MLPICVEITRHVVENCLLCSLCRAQKLCSQLRRRLSNAWSSPLNLFSDLVSYGDSPVPTSPRRGRPEAVDSDGGRGSQQRSCGTTAASKASRGSDK